MARAALLAVALSTFARPASAGAAGSWYLSRGRANARIGNHAAAIEAYRKALEADTGSREASRSLGMELLRNGETDRAVAEFDRHLGRFPDDREIAFEQAHILQWSRYAYRARDAVRYLRMGLAAGDDPTRRRDLARLLGRDRATLDEALREYDRLLAASAGDQELRDERLRLLLWGRAHRAEAIAELERRQVEQPGDERVQRELARLTAEDPARAAEAAARYGALLARHPDDPQLRLGRARALARAGRRPEARAAYAQALAVPQPVEARLEHADLLAADRATRGSARAEYEAVLRESPRSRRARLGLARVLASERKTSGASIGQYEAVLADAPRDAEAHAGLARAYAWNGDPDRALAHALTASSGRPGSDVAALERELRRGRESALGGGARALSQSGAAFGVSSIRGFASASADPGPFTSAAAEAGLSTYRAGTARAEGPFAGARGEWRPDAGLRVGSRLEYDGARPGAGALSGDLSLEHRVDARVLSLSASRIPRGDSFRALAGEPVNGRTVGAASDNVVQARAEWTADGGRVAIYGKAGAVTGLGMPATFTAAAGVRAERTVLRLGRWALGAGAAFDSTHHARDLSGADGDPAAPRLFSPPLFAALSPRLVASRDAGLGGRLVVDAGPAIQLVAGSGRALRGGWDVRAALVHRFGDRLRLDAELRAERVAAVYARVEGGAALAFLF